MGRLYIYPHEWLMFMVNVGKYTIPGWYGEYIQSLNGCRFTNFLRHFQRARNIVFSIQIELGGTSVRG